MSRKLVEKIAAELSEKLEEAGQLEKINEIVNNKYLRKEVLDLLAQEIFNRHMVHVDERFDIFYAALNEISANFEKYKELQKKSELKTEYEKSKKAEYYKKERNRRLLREYLAGRIPLGEFNKLFDSKNGASEISAEQEDEIDAQEEPLDFRQENDFEDRLENPNETERKEAGDNKKKSPESEKRPIQELFEFDKIK